ncbi:hypothetical protein A3D00_02805 [Candidatus Woesebacteria bacterium RIFCSPHIGHO2_02_FULL_38_9]|uniref:Uncharacterized protein n=1 Tax=Candidatus Woesebacteria bacterium RIFCSPHIGHO2_01_FULL_39_28 TaxID=1802496 RepID=A0A1F7YEA8_9BACT|nr:MAG: hypothetical protein A2627_04395 [Candidatus Woesebacteria bacterium RIFCSPHIGHO2_01_FULL_39_28]OGM35179.1 MAG: hypothetical protein A3D00_02805 [Candidatus Woesebacteria bacterium RIFCSPHIGHO2_02_FULL_38_9]OGM57768.1 MAG: hypothetical protein A3A50_05655 [Candidatus Woesebacteria bacterium RIFCSPLOWO2_01_FULL_38_20]
MSKKYELEKRALVEAELVEKIIKLLDRKAQLEKTFERFSIIFWNHAEAKLRRRLLMIFGLGLRATRDCLL